MSLTMKGDIINLALSKMQISGILVNPRPEETDLALNALEIMANELKAKNMDTGYKFEDAPDTSSPHGIELKFVDHIASMLAFRIAVNFGKVDQMLALQSSAACSFIASATAIIPKSSYPSRMPMGSGNRTSYWNDNFYEPVYDGELTSAKETTMIVGDIEDFTESFEAYLNSGEDVASYTIESSTADVTIVSDSLSTPIVSYRLEAVTSSVDTINITIKATTSTGRVKTRTIPFKVDAE